MKRWFAYFAAMVVISMVMAACVAPPSGPAAPAEEAAPAAESSGPVEGGTLIVARGGDVTTWDPVPVGIDNYTLWAMHQVYATLIINTPDGKALEPWLAESYEISEDAKTFTFKLRENAAFCDGTPITAHDVKWSMDRALADDSAVLWQFPADPQVEVIDDYNLTITLNRSNVAFASYLTLWGASVLSQKHAEEVGMEALVEQPLGSGPFCLGEWEKDQYFTLTPNPGYWGDDGPYVDEVRVLTVPDDNSRALQVTTGEIDIALDLPYSQLDALAGAEGVVVSKDTLYGTAAIVLNQHTVEQFKDKNIRLAMAHAIDRQAMVDAVLMGNGQVANSSFYGPGVLYWTDEFGIPYDLEKAKQLMAESSDPDGFAVDLVVEGGDSRAQQTAVILQDQLAEIGIEVSITPVEPGTWWEMWSGEQYEMLYKLGTNDVIDPAENIPFDFWSFEEGGSDAAYTGYYNAELVQLSMDAEAELDPAKRAELYREVQRISMEDSPQLWLFHPDTVWATRDNIKGFSVFPTKLHRFWNAWKTE
jgi:peptide/nickel transport system substrate-binding protein